MAEPGLHPGVRVEPVTGASWRAYRDVRQAALIDSPRAFWTTWAESAARTDEDWQAFVETGPVLWLAWEGDRPVGTVGLWRAEDQPDEEAHLIGMWVAGAARGSGVAAALVEAAVARARAEGRTRLSLDVTLENPRARRFYLRCGFVPTGERATMPWDPTCVEERMVRTLTP